MYLHLGQAVVVPMSGILGIFDLDNTTSSRHTRDFLARAEKEGRVVDVSGELPKSFVLFQREEGNSLVYLCQVAYSTLLKRVEGNSMA